MNETQKSQQRRQENGDFQYLSGNGIDIGCGSDVLKVQTGTVIGWDIDDGDAQLMEGVADNTFDFVYSSHCLEHMRDPCEALGNWARILKPNCYLFVVVPDWDLYEHRFWPSRYNIDHKQSFSLTQSRKQAHPSHWQIGTDLLPPLNCSPVLTRLEADGINVSLGLADQTLFGALAQIVMVYQKCKSAS